MIIYSYICLAVSFASFAVSTIKFTHFFQLNSYRVKLQLKWLGANLGKILPNLVFGVLMMLSTLVPNVTKTTFLVLSAIGLYLSRPKKAKKPLVYTMRVRRLLITCGIIYIISMVAAIFYKKAFLVSAVLFLTNFFVIIVANLINRPVENAVANYYINDAKKMLKSSNATVIGVTGSYGKTSIKYYLSALLKGKFNVLITPESYNTPMGVVKTIRSSLTPLHEIFVCEMGAKRVGEIKEICDIVHPTHGIITSIGPQHLETFKTLSNIQKTKFELADSLPNDGLLVLNVSDENINSYRGERKCIGYSINGNSQYTASDICIDENGTTFTVTAPNGTKEKFTTKLIGTHSVINITGAIAMANSLGVDFSTLKSQVKKLKSVPHRLELVHRGNDIIIDDAYNSNPSGTKAALETLGCFEGVKILLTPGMVELGEKQDELNREFGTNAAKVCDRVILVGKRQTESIKKGLDDAGYDNDKIYIASDLNDAINYAYSLNTHGERKIILLENDLPDNY